LAAGRGVSGGGGGAGRGAAIAISTKAGGRRFLLAPPSPRERPRPPKATACKPRLAAITAVQIASSVVLRMTGSSRRRG
jgi:hypothetical protein